MGGMGRTQIRTLELEGPSATCSRCRFASALKGTWSVEDGRLAWRGDADPQPGRGPDLDGCCEGSDCGDFGRITTDYLGEEALTGGQVAALRATAADARLHEFDGQRGE
jgi:hypothetical protein